MAAPPPAPCFLLYLACQRPEHQLPAQPRENLEHQMAPGAFTSTREELRAQYRTCAHPSLEFIKGLIPEVAASSLALEAIGLGVGTRPALCFCNVSRRISLLPGLAST